MTMMDRQSQAAMQTVFTVGVMMMNYERIPACLRKCCPPATLLWMNLAPRRFLRVILQLMSIVQTLRQLSSWRWRWRTRMHPTSDANQLSSNEGSWSWSRPPTCVVAPVVGKNVGPCTLCSALAWARQVHHSEVTSSSRVTTIQVLLGMHVFQLIA